MTITSDSHFHSVKAVLDSINIDDIDTIVHRIIDAPMILTCGNGGSAATAIHLASDLRSLNYTAFDLLSPSKITQIDNDDGHTYMFSHQAKQHPEALVIAFSGSGTSLNIQALAYALPDRLVLITSEMKSLHYPGVEMLKVDSVDYEVIEDVHMCICHAIKKELKARKEQR